jgi:hypothetical protein
MYWKNNRPGSGSVLETETLNHFSVGLLFIFRCSRSISGGVQKNNQAWLSEYNTAARDANELRRHFSVN